MTRYFLCSTAPHISGDPSVIDDCASDEFIILCYDRLIQFYSDRYHNLRKPYLRHMTNELAQTLSTHINLYDPSLTMRDFSRAAVNDTADIVHALTNYPHEYVTNDNGLMISGIMTDHNIDDIDMERTTPVMDAINLLNHTGITRWPFSAPSAAEKLEQNSSSTIINQVRCRMNTLPVPADY